MILCLIRTTNHKKPPKNRTCLICNLIFVVMLEKRKDDSESIQKFQGMLMAAIIGGLLLFIAPVMVVYIAGVDTEGHDTAEQALFALPDEGNLPEEFTTKVNSIFDLVIWVARVVVVLFISDGSHNAADAQADIRSGRPAETAGPNIQAGSPAMEDYRYNFFNHHPYAVHFCHVVCPAWSGCRAFNTVHAGLVHGRIRDVPVP